MITRLRVWWLFYKSFAALGIVISLSCAVWYSMAGTAALEGIALIKGITGAVIFGSLRYFDLRRPVFFYNLHYSPRQLWAGAFGMDTALLLLFLLIAKLL